MKSIKKIENDLRRIFEKYDCIFFEQLSELMSDIISTWEELRWDVKL